MDPNAQAAGVPSLPAQQPGVDPSIWQPQNQAQLLADLQMKGIGTIDPDLLNLYMQMFGFGGKNPIGYGQTNNAGTQTDPVMLLQQQDALRQMLSDSMAKQIGGQIPGGQLSPQQIASIMQQGGPKVAQLVADAAKPPAPSGGSSAALTTQRQGEVATPSGSYPLPSMPPDVAAAMAGATPIPRGAPGATQNPFAPGTTPDMPDDSMLLGGGAGPSSAVKAAQGAANANVGGGFNFGDVFGGLLGAGTGGLNALLASQKNNLPGEIGGGLQGIGGIASLLKGLDLGFPGLGAVGSVAGGLGGALTLEQAIQGIASGKLPPQQAVMQLVSGGMSLYSAIAGLSSIFPNLIGTVLPSLTELAGTGITAGLGALGLGAPLASTALGAGVAGGAGAGAAGAGAAAGSLGAGATGAIFAAPLALGILGTDIGSMIDTSANARGAASTAKKFANEVPGQIASFDTLPNLFDQAQQGNMPIDKAMQIFNQINNVAGPNSEFWVSGLGNALRQGQTSARGGSLGDQVTIDLPFAGQVNDRLSQDQPFYGAGLLNIEDIIGKDTGGKIPDLPTGPSGFTGWQTPDVFAAGSGNANFENVFAPSTPDTQSYGGYFRNDSGQIMDPGSSNQYELTPAGYRNKGIMDYLSKLTPGDYAQGLSDLFNEYGGPGSPMGYPSPDIGNNPTLPPLPGAITPQSLQALIQQLQVFQPSPDVSSIIASNPSGGGDAGGATGGDGGTGAGGGDGGGGGGGGAP